MNKINEVDVSVDFAELQNRANKLRHRAEGIIIKAKEQLESAAKESGLPVSFVLSVAMKFPQPAKAGDKNTQKDPK